MPRKKRTPATGAVGDDRQDAGPTGTKDLFDRAKVEVRPDGRVQAQISGIEDPEDELIAITSQRKAAAFIINDVAPRVTREANKVKPFGVKS